MLRATAVVRREAVPPEAVADTITLDHAGRHRRRLSMRTDRGLSFLLDLDKTVMLDDGDAVRLEDGRLVQIRAAPERLVQIRADDPLRLKKIIWHLGNRHVPAEIDHDAVYIAEDHVLIDMVRGLGGLTTLVERPFRPEHGAYEAHHLGHDPHGHGHGHSHAHG